MRVKHVGGSSEGNAASGTVLPKGPLHTFLLSWKLLILVAPTIHNSSLCCFGIRLIDWH